MNVNLINLNAQGFHFVFSDIDGLTDLRNFILNQLNIKQRLELVNRLLKAWRIEPISVQEAFDEYFYWHKDEDYGQEDFLCEFLTGDEGILDGIDRILSQDTCYKDVKLILEYLDEVLDPNDFSSWKLFGYSQGEIEWAWQYSNDKQYKSLPEYKLMALLESAVFD